MRKKEKETNKVSEIVREEERDKERDKEKQMDGEKWRGRRKERGRRIRRVKMPYLHRMTVTTGEEIVAGGRVPAKNGLVAGPAHQHSAALVHHKAAHVVLWAAQHLHRRFFAN